MTTGKKARRAATQARFAQRRDDDSLVDTHIHAELSATPTDTGSVSGAYAVPMPPAVLAVLAFALGVLVAFGITYAYSKREEHVRKQKMLKPLLSSR